MTPSAAALARAIGPSTVASRATHAERSRLLTVGVCALVLAAPFETRVPLLHIPGQELSSLELVLLTIVGAWAASAVWTRTPLFSWRDPLVVPWIAFVAAMGVAALASAHLSNAVHMVGRLALAFLVYAMTVSAASTSGARRAVSVAVVAAGAAAAVLVILEYLGVAAVMRWLGLFRADVALVGAQVRAGGPFQYPTIAAMFLEIAFAIGLGLLLAAVDSGRRALLFLITGVLLLISEAVILTYTRAGLLAMALALGIVAWRRHRSHGFDRAVRTIAVIAALIGVQLVSSRSVESLRLRFVTEGQESWYRAEIEAPRVLTMRARERTRVPVTLTNTGGNTWDPWARQPFRLSYHWLLADEDRVVSWEGLRTEFAAPIAPDETVSLQALVEAPRHPGRYRLLWDIEQEHRVWFSTEPNSTLAISTVAVTGAALGPAEPLTTIPMPRRAVRPRRFVLWRAAARMVADRPLLGVGPDNYRLLYGEYAGLVPADPRIHSNNMYLEVLAGGGVVGALAFAWLAWRAAALGGAAAAGVAAAIAAIGAHGVFDSFLGFTPTYVLIAITLGLASAGAVRTSHAHRI